MGRGSPCGAESRDSKSGPRRRDKQKTRTERTTALSRLKTGAGRVETFAVLEMASGIRAGESDSFLVFMADERDGFQLNSGGRKPAGNHVNGIALKFPFRQGFGLGILTRGDAFNPRCT